VKDARGGHALPVPAQARYLLRGARALDRYLEHMDALIKATRNG